MVDESALKFKVDSPEALNEPPSKILVEVAVKEIEEVPSVSKDPPPSIELVELTKKSSEPPEDVNEPPSKIEVSEDKKEIVDSPDVAMLPPPWIVV